MPADKPFCFVASPFAGEGATAEECAADMARNIEFAESICRRVALETSLIPLAPHLVFPQFLNDHDPAERDLGISYAKKIMPLCSLAIFAIPPWRSGASSGMRFEDEIAIENRVDRMLFCTGMMFDVRFKQIAERFPRK